MSANAVPVPLPQPSLWRALLGRLHLLGRRRSQLAGGEPLDLIESALDYRMRRWYVDPELRKVLGVIKAQLSETRRLSSLPNAITPLKTSAALGELSALLRRDVSKLRLDGAWELAGDLKRLNLRFADREYMTSQLEYEKRRATREGNWHGWNTHFDKRDLGRLLTNFTLHEPTLAHYARAVDRLNFLYLKREEAGRDRRARAELKKLFLNALAALLLLLLAGFGVAANFTTHGRVRETLLLAICAGALGSTLSGIIKVRDQLDRLEELRSFRPAMRVQPLIGACAGAFLLLALRSHAVSFGSASKGWEGIGFIAFVAGFSEPFFLGVVQKVAGASGRQAAEARKNS
jgi:hypothetical protein